MKKNIFIILILFTALINHGCTKLHENVGSNLTPAQITIDSSYAAILLQGVYGSLDWTFSSFQQIFALSEITTDEAIAPTRGNNWDDNGQWRVLHQQTWDPNNLHVHECFNSLGGVVYAATDMLKYNATPRQKAEAGFLRAWAMYWLLDMFNQVPYREAGESTVPPSHVRTGMNALDYIIGELNAVEADLPDGPAGRANKYAARMLLMKCYLNKGVYMNRQNPGFDPADMNRVIALADSIIKSGNFHFSKNYFDNFCPDNGSIGIENIFTQLSSSREGYAIQVAWIAGFSFPQFGANGFSTLPDFYEKFEPLDKRREDVYPYSSAPPNPGHRVNVGFLNGQQYDLKTGDSLFSGLLPVIFTPEVHTTEPGPNIEMTGIRAIKYAPDYSDYPFYNFPCSNDFVYFRFTDVLLMKAEAILRNGTGTDAGPYGNNALSIVNAIRTDKSRNASALSTIDLDKLFDERGRELWWENWRRQDMIRFKKFLLPFYEKRYQSDPKYLLFPIPYDQLAVNPYLAQNAGY